MAESSDDRAACKRDEQQRDPRARRREQHRSGEQDRPAREDDPDEAAQRKDPAESKRGERKDARQQDVRLGVAVRLEAGEILDMAGRVKA